MSIVELPEQAGLPAELRPNIDHLIFEDGQAMDRVFTERQQRFLVATLYDCWEGPPDSGKFVAVSNVGLFSGLDLPHQVPDALLGIHIEVHRDPRPREHHSYLIWEYGQPPEVVIEIVSDGNGGELTSKFRAYERIGIAYYVVFDPDRRLGEQVLRVFRRDASRFVPQPEAWFPTVGLGLSLWQGVYEGIEAEWLRWCRQDGTLIPTGAERIQQLQQQQERLLAQLRALGVEPDVGPK